MTVTSTLSLLSRSMLSNGKKVISETWQGVHEPQAMIELLNQQVQVDTFKYHPECVVQRDIYEDIKPYTPWAIDHLIERITGEPRNPGESYKIWPHYQKEGVDEQFRNQDGLFFGTYQERIWSTYNGLHFTSGNIQSVIDLLNRTPSTRQAYLPLFWPEDTGAPGGRAFCSLGYHFYIRNGKLHMNYYMRSADLVRHFKNDIYFSVGIMYYVLAKLKLKDILPGLLNIYITSLHVFESDKYNLRKNQFLNAHYEAKKVAERRSLYADSIPHII